MCVPFFFPWLFFDFASLYGKGHGAIRGLSVFKGQETTPREPDPEFPLNFWSFIEKDIVCQNHF